MESKPDTAMNKHELHDHSAGFRYFDYLDGRIKWRRAVGSKVFEPAERYAQLIPTGSA